MGCNILITFLSSGASANHNSADIPAHIDRVQKCTVETRRRNLTSIGRSKFLHLCAVETLPTDIHNLMFDHGETHRGEGGLRHQASMSPHPVVASLETVVLNPIKQLSEETGPLSGWSDIGEVDIPIGGNAHEANHCGRVARQYDRLTVETSFPIFAASPMRHPRGALRFCVSAISSPYGFEHHVRYFAIVCTRRPAQCEFLGHQNSLSDKIWPDNRMKIRI